MTKINFTNLPDTSTPLNATNMNALQTNTENAINQVANDNIKQNIPDNKFSMETGVTLIQNHSFTIGNMVFINLKISSNITDNYKTYLTIDNSLKPTSETNLLASTNYLLPSNGWVRSNGEIAIGFSDNKSDADIRILSFYSIA